MANNVQKLLPYTIPVFKRVFLILLFQLSIHCIYWTNRCGFETVAIYTVHCTVYN